MKLYNTLTRQIEEFKPLNPPKVTFYHCGPTVYWIQHIGNLRGMTLADLIRRSLIYLNYQVTFVRNYTDVGHLTSDQDTGEDKMEKGAKREGLSPDQIADKYIEIFENDTKLINILRPNFTPRATEYIKEMQIMIQVLLDKNYAYITDQAILYDVSKFQNYNQLNHQKMTDLLKSSGKGEIINPQKHHFADFNLWVFKKGVHKNALQSWPSPWGEGFPGWHIECSVMVKKILGDTIDIHMGGIEHISVHHTNEIAQSEAVNRKKFVNYWLHNEWLVAGNEKMAKSTGTGFTLKQIIDKGFNPLSLRYLFLNAHYRSRQNFTWEALTASSEALKKLYEHVLVFRKQVSPQFKSTKTDDFKIKFKNALANDFQTPQALAVMWEMVKSDISASDKLNLLFEFDQVLGLKLNQVITQSIPKNINCLAEERQAFKSQKKFFDADKLRERISQLGYSIKDIPNGYIIKKK